MYASCAELAAQIGPQLVTLLHEHEEEIVREVHPGIARWAVRRVLPAVARWLPLLADHVIGFLAHKLRDVTLGEVAGFVDHLVSTSDFQSVPELTAYPED